MIKVDRGITEIAGGLAEIMAETALILTNVYVISKRRIWRSRCQEDDRGDWTRSDGGQNNRRGRKGKTLLEREV